MVATYSYAENPQESFELGDLLMSYLEQLDIEYVFGIPGGSIEPLYNALARSEQRNGPRSITARHETGAAFMAEGYTRATGKIGVCCATTGPGATNLITGVSSAYENQIPMLVITAQTAISNFGKGSVQESSCTGLNTLGMFQHCTRYNTLVSHTDQFEQKLVSAVMTAYQFPQGPVHLSIPIDIMRKLAHTSSPNYDLAMLTQQPTLVDENATKKLGELIEQADQPVFVLGADCASAAGTILELAIQLQALIVTTPEGRGFISPHHPLYRGTIGIAGHITANNLLSDKKTDLVIAIGTKLGEGSTGGWDPTTIMNDRLVHIESDAGRLIRSPMAKLQIRGNLNSVFNQLLSSMTNSDDEQATHDYKQKWTQHLADITHTKQQVQFNFKINNQEKCFSEATPIKPQRLMYGLTEQLPPKTLYVADSGNSMMWAIHYLHPYDRRLAGQRTNACSLLHVSVEFGSMGWAIGTSIGMALARKSQPVVCITGDGSHLMSGQEITVAVQEQLPLIYVILNDSAFGIVRHGQQLGNAEPIAFNLPVIDFSLYAQSIGANGYCINSPADLKALDFKKLLAQKGPTILDVRVDREEVSPIADRIKVLHSHYEEDRIR
ncbi:MAG: thiamine pyrophosphate-binding protein [Methylococcales bacterium]